MGFKVRVNGGFVIRIAPRLARIVRDEDWSAAACNTVFEKLMAFGWCRL